MGGNICYTSERYGHATLFTYASGLTVTCTSANVYFSTISAALVMGSWAAVGDVLPDAANAKVTILRSGNYRVSFSISAGSSKVAKLHADVFVNGVERKQIAAERDISSVGQVGNFGATGDLFLKAGDVVYLRFESDTNATVITFEHLSLNVERTSRA